VRSTMLCELTDLSDHRRFVSPAWLMTASLCIWGAVWLVAPISYAFAVSEKAFLVLVAFTGAFYAGAVLVEWRCERRPGRGSGSVASDGRPWNMPGLQVAFKWLTSMAIVGLVLRFCDLFLVKNYLAYGSPAAYKLHYESSSTEYGIMSVASGLLFPFAVVPLMLVFYGRKALSRRQRLMSWAFVILLLCYAVLISGRTTVALLLVILAVASYLASHVSHFQASQGWVSGLHCLC